jgi:hypothetical protein
VGGGRHPVGKEAGMLRLGLMLVIGLASSAVLGQEPPKPDDLNRAYQDALGQLKAAQDRKNELANENMQLLEQIADLHRQLADARRQLDRAADRTYFYRSHYAAWQVFIRQYPALKARWTVFLKGNLLALHDMLPELMQSDWTEAVPTWLE